MVILGDVTDPARFSRPIRLSDQQKSARTFRKKKTTYRVSPPLYRSDITRAEDLVEEILKVYDYNQIPGSLPI